MKILLAIDDSKFSEARYFQGGSPDKIEPGASGSVHPCHIVEPLVARFQKFRAGESRGD